MTLFNGLCIKDWCLMPFSVFNLFLAQWIIVILSEWWKPDNFELHLKNLALRIFQAFVRILWNVNHSLNQTPDILALCETNLDDSIHSGNFSLRGYLAQIWNDSIIPMHGLAVYVREGLPFARELSLKTLRILTYVFDWLYFTQCLTSFFSIDHLFRLYVRFLILFHLT